MRHLEREHCANEINRGGCTTLIARLSHGVVRLQTEAELKDLAVKF